MKTRPTTWSSNTSGVPHNKAYRRWWSCWLGSAGSELGTGRTGAHTTSAASRAGSSDLSLWPPAGSTATGTPSWSEPLPRQTSNIQCTETPQRERDRKLHTVSHQSLPWIRDGEETKQTDRGNGKDEKDEDIQRRELILSDEDVEAKMGCRKRKMIDGCWMFWKRKTFSAFINISARRFQDCLRQQTHRDVAHRSVDDRSDALSSAAPSWFVWGQKWPYLDDFCLSIVFLTLNGTKTYKMNIMLC